MKGNCGECESRYTCTIDPNECNEWPDPVPQTNADRIRAMSDDELAELVGKYVYCGLCPLQHRCIAGECNKVVMEWLQQPAEEDEK